MLADTLYVLLFLFSTGSSFYAPQISTNHVIQQDDITGRFIELEEGETLQIECLHPLNEEVDFGVPPDLLDNKGHDPTDYALRKSIQEVNGGSELSITNTVESDSGTYSCHVLEDPSLGETVHVFVKGSSVFIPFRGVGLAVDESQFVVPCRTNRHVSREDVVLEVNEKLWKTATKHYDSRKGFLMNSKTMEQKITTETKFKCIYKGTPEDRAEFLISIKEETDTNDLELEWQNPSEWPYVDGPFSLSCVLKEKNHGKIVNKYTHYLNISCPRCDTDVVKHSRTVERQDKIVHTIDIDSMSMEDSGTYTCNWFYEKKLLAAKPHSVVVSPKKEQIRMIERSSASVSVSEGDTFRLSANLTGFPEDLPGFTAKWIRKFVRPPKKTNETETVLTDIHHQLESDLPGNGMIHESLTVTNAQSNMSGVYVLFLTMMDTVKTIEFEAVIKSAEIIPRIDIMTADSFVLFDQNYYKPGTALRVLCLVGSVPHAEVDITRKRIYGGPAWIDVDSDQLTAVNGTYESGYQWDTILEDDVDIRCTGRIGGKVEERKKRVRVSDIEPSVNTTWKSPSPLFEDKLEIYEGDLVQLRCMFPKDEEWKVKWMFRDEEVGDTENIIAPSSHSRHLIANIPNISSSQAGEYTCVLSNNNSYFTLKQIINVKKTMKPYHLESDPEKLLEMKYGTEVTLDCNMDGTPKPQYIWLKDNRIYEAGKLSEDNRTLFISRVASEDHGEFVCQATNRAGSSTYKIVTKVKGAPKRVSAAFIVLFGFMMLILVCCLLAAVVLYLKQKKRSREQERALSVLYEQLMRAADGPPPPSNQKIPLDQRVYQLPYNRQFELERDHLEIGNRIGAGQFGQVWMGWLSKPRRVSDQSVERARLPVAVKGPLSGRNPEHQKMLAEELKIMCAIGRHPNVLTLIGAVTRNMKNGELFVVVEMCDNGNLKEYLLKNKNRFLNELKQVKQSDNGGYLAPKSATRTQYAAEQNTDWAGEMESERLLPDTSSMLATSDLISMSMQIANGMEYLASIPCIHRDLAARNILLTNNRFCRIADFGMARSENKEYYKVRKSKNIPVPYRWYSVEAIQNGIFTQESDVWSFGVVLFEIFSMGGLPYPSVSNEDLLDRLLSGYRNSRPDYCHEEIYALMQQCWETEPAKRPNFSQCLHTLKEHLRLASPQLLMRLETEIVQEGERQAALSNWRANDVVEIEQGSINPDHAASSSKHEERIYIKEFDHPT